MDITYRLALELKVGLFVHQNDIKQTRMEVKIMIKLFLVHCIQPNGVTSICGNGTPLPEKQANKFKWSHEGGISTAHGYQYVVRPVQ